MKRFATTVLVVVGLTLTACGSSATPVATTAPASNSLDGIKTYLQNYGAQMKSNAECLQAETKKYYDAVKAANFDYKATWGDGSTLRPIVLKMRECWTNADNSYESVEGIVAGVPSLADYDVILDSGRADGDGGTVAQFTLTLPDGKQVKNPGSFYNWLIEPQLFGTKKDWIGQTDIDVDGDGKIGFGDVLPEANLIMASADGLVKYTDETLTAIGKWQPTQQDAFQALLTMTPTMEEYFNNWKESRFVSGDAAAKDQVGFVSKTRLVDVTRIVGSLNTIYGGVNDGVSAKNPEMAKQLQTGYTDLESFAQDLLKKEQSGTKFTPAQAETLGKEAQDRAQALAGQVAQAAALLDVKVQQ